ncbi:MAG: T9SS type A sorting domain-containing protein [Bacteroidales bacterium]|nr:T9SS type A sorting domain-containing protein [Bacteroidales bacterium]
MGASEFISQTTGLGIVESADFEIFPNPAREYINIRFNRSACYKIMLISSEGRVMRQVSGNGNRITLETGHLPKGLYIIQLTTLNGTGRAKCIIE